MKKRAFAKVNIFLKIVGFKNGFHQLVSRFILIEDIFDEIEFKKSKDGFKIEGDFGCELEKNTIFKAYLLLKKEFNKVEKFFKEYKVVVKKGIPLFSGLGGSSSNAATFILMCNEFLELNLTKNRIFEIGKQIGADLNFFLSQFKSANVFGFGEIVEEFEDEIPEIKIETLKERCLTKEVYNKFKERKKSFFDFNEAKKLASLKSTTLINFNPYFLNDLSLPASFICPKIKNALDKGYFLSGSGSSVFIPSSLKNQARLLDG